MRRLYLTLSLALSGLLALAVPGCTIAQPFQDVEATDGAVRDGTAVVAVTHAVVPRRYRADFYDYTRRLEESLGEQPGLLGYSLRRKLSGAEGWTMTVWSGEEALSDFYYSPLHGEALDALQGKLEGTRSCRFEVPVADLPISWERALEELEAARPWGSEGE